MLKLSTFSEYDAELQLWLERLQMIDALLERPALSVVDEVVQAAKRAADDGSPLAVRVQMSRRKSGDGSVYLSAACCSTVQRLAQRRRRFSWLSSDAIRTLGETSQQSFILLSEKAEHDPLRIYQALVNEPLGATSPLAAAEIFWVLIKAGEKHAHGSLGFFCIFNMLWALMERREITGRAPRVKACPTAFVAAKCLLPLRLLRDILHRRAAIYRRIAKLTRELDRNARGSTQRDRWLVVTGFERLASALNDFSKVASDPHEYVGAAAKVTALADLFTTNTPDPQQRWSTVRGYLVRLLRNSSAVNDELLGTAEKMLNGLEPLLRGEESEGEESKKFDNSPERRAQLLAALDLEEEEWEATLRALRDAHRSCTQFLGFLQRGAAIGSKFFGPAGSATPSAFRVCLALRGLAAVNERVARAIEGAVEDNTYGMRDIITQEVAKASAGDRTNFDAAELIAALTIVERWLRISDLEVDDALKWSVSGANADGSWTSRHPIAMNAGVSELWPGSSEAVWMLAMAVEKKPRLRMADDALHAYVQWLDRTRIDLPRGENLSGWPSEVRSTEVIDTAATVSAVNALLSIRDLFEERLWELSQRRFLVKIQNKSLFDIDPVDLGARHEKRLHRRLMRMAREASGDDYEKAEYSLVLHGPPGSSKSALAEAVAGNMPRRRLIRITPADFTRQGEAGLDAEARFIFSLLSHLRGATIVFDEVDDLLKKRKPDEEMSFIRLVVPAMLNRLQDLRDAAPRQEICFMFATNYIDAIELALTRPGRFDATLAVPYPDAWSRENILMRNMDAAAKANPDQTLLVDRSQQAALITETEAWPWSTFNSMCRELTMRPAGTAKDIDLQIERHKEAVDESLSYYQRVDRWAELSRPLQIELMHALFALSSRQAADARLEKFADWLEKLKQQPTWIDRKKLLDQLDREWKNTSRPKEWKHEPARPRVEVKGSEKTMGASIDSDGTATFRVWAPFALQAAVAGDFNDWSRSEHEMERVREMPGVWEITLDQKTTKQLLQPAADGTPAGQYRYVFTTPDADVWRADPCGRAWFYRGSYQNSVVVQTANVQPRNGLADHQVVGCRVRLCDRTFDELTERIEPLREIGFNLIELVPACDQITDERWGFDARLPYGVRHTAEGWKLRDLCARISDAKMQIVLGAPWGFGSAGEGHPLHRFDGWSSETYKGGIYFRQDGGTLDLDEPRICNLIADHARESVQTLGLSGIHLMFDSRILSSQNGQAASLADNLAALPKQWIWVDSDVDLMKISRPRPASCNNVRSHLVPKEENPNKPFIPFAAFKNVESAFRHVTVVSADEPSRAVHGAAAFALPAIPLVNFSDELLQQSAWSDLIRALIRARTEADSPLADGRFDDLTKPGERNMLAFRRTAEGGDAVILINVSPDDRAATLPTNDPWTVRLRTDAAPYEPQGITAERTTDVPRQSAKILYSCQRTTAR